jgi:hypothetical protein
MYDDVVLSQRPVCYLGTNDRNYGYDLSDMGGFAYSVTDMEKFGVTPFGRLLKNQVSAPNEAEIGSSNRQRRQFSIDFWARPFGYGVGSSTDLFTTSDGSIRIYSYVDRIVFEVIDADGVVYSAFRTVPDIESALHICCIFTKSIMIVVVNAMPGDSVSLPADFTWGDPNTTIYFEPGVSSPAVFNRASSSDEILARYMAGTTSQDFAVVVGADGGDHWDFSRRWQTPAAQIVIDSEDWRSGVLNNVVIDRENSLTVNYHEDLVSYLSGVEAAPSFSAGRLVLGTDRCVTRSAMGGLSNSEGALTLNVSLTTPGTTKTIVSVYDARGGIEWRWYVDSAMDLHLDKLVIAADGSETLTTYDYDNVVSTSFDFAIVMRGGSIEVSSGSNITNPVGGLSTIPESISVNDKTLVIFGADHELVGPGVDSINNISFFNFIPAYVDFADLVSWATPTTTYVTTNDDLEAITNGYWDYQFSFPYEGLFAGHSITWAGSGSTGALDRGSLSISDDGSIYTTITQREQKFSVLPDTGDMGNTVDAGPYYVRISVIGKGKSIGFYRSVVITLFSSAEIKSVNTDKVASIVGTAHTSTMDSRQPWLGVYNANMRLIGSANTRIDFPSDTFRAVELVIRAPDTAESGSILSFNDGTLREISYAAGGNISSTGFLSFYVNAALTAGTYASQPGELLHMIGILSADATSAVSVGRKYDGTGNTPNNMGLYSYATYETEPSYDAIYEHYQASTGLVWTENYFANYAALTENLPYIYTLAWETTGATT